MKLEEIDLYVTNKCNLHCCFCSVLACTRSDEIPMGKIKTVIDEAIKFGLTELHLTGGEPTIRTDLESIIEYAVSRNLHVRLITNGTLLTMERLRSLYAHGLRSIMISLDGLPVYHDKVRGMNGACQKALAAIANALEIGMYTRVNSVAWMDNRSDLLELIILLNEMKVDVYSIFLGSPLGYAIQQKDNIINSSQWREFYCQIKSLVVEKKIQTKIVLEKGYLYEDENPEIVNKLKGRGRGCYLISEHTDFLLIQSNGNVYPCVFYSNEAEPIGNIFASSLEQIVENFSNNSYYKSLGNYPEECTGCPKLRYCHGGCRGYAKLCNQNWHSKDPRCNIHQECVHIPLCPIVKLNINENLIGGSSEQVL